MAFITTVLFIPVYIVLVWNYLHPEESMLFGDRWMFKNEPEFSDEAIFYRKSSSIAGMILLTAILQHVYFSNNWLTFFMFVCFFIYVGVQIRRFYKLFIE